MWRLVLEVALAISVGVNVYLLTRHRDAVPPPVAPVVEPRACPPAPPLPDAGAMLITVAVDANATAPVCPPAAKADCSAVEKKLEESEAKLEAQQPPAERYKHGLRAVDVEARARALLDPIFAGISKSPHAYDVECHGSVCKVSGADPSLSYETWMREIQRHGGFQGMEFTGWDAYAVMGTPGETAQSKLLGEIGAALNPDAGLAKCSGGTKPSGSLTLQIALDMATQHLIVTTSGSLASEKLGQCVKAAVQTALDAIKVPSGVDRFSQEFPLLR